MTENIFDILNDLSMVKRVDSDCVFVNKKTGKLFRRGWISKCFRNACKDAKVNNFRFLDLRHDF